MPGKPQQDGRHERMHETPKEQTANPPSATFAEQQRAFDRSRSDYNEHRPHEALGLEPPAAHYEPSRRVVPERLGPIEYDPVLAVRRTDESRKLPLATAPSSGAELRSRTR